MFDSLRSYSKNLYFDYYEVFKEVHRNAKKRPVRATLYGTSIIFVLNMFRTNEGLQSYTNDVVTACNRMGCVAENLRNPASNEYVQTIGELNGYRQLRQVDLGFSTLVYKTDSNPEVRLFKYNCKYFNPSIKEFFTERLVDLGVLGHWLVLELKMRNYDINEEEYKGMSN